MGYNYTKEKPYVATNEGQYKLFKVYDKAKEVTSQVGCVRADILMDGLTGSSWGNMAVVDRLIEPKLLREVHRSDAHVLQHRIFEMVR